VFNLRPQIERLALPGGGVCWVIDNVLQDPDTWVQRAVQQRAQFVAAPFNAYPGLEWRMAADVSGPLNDFFMLHLRGLMGARRTLDMYSRLSLVTLMPAQLRPLQRLCHRDRLGVGADQTVAACTLYLFKDSLLGGTSFFVPRLPLAQINAHMPRWNAMDDAAFTQEIGTAPAYLTASDAFFELVQVVPAAFNRAVFYDGNQFHSSHIEDPATLSADPAHGRLTLNGFFTCRRNAA
jgi:hypothetical protein